jgi:hypothetical protein
VAAVIVDHLHLVAILVAAGSAWAVVRIVKKMTFEGVGFEDGGGYTALLVAGVMVNLIAVAVALS